MKHSQYELYLHKNQIYLACETKYITCDEILHSDQNVLLKCLITISLLICLIYQDTEFLLVLSP